MMPVNAGWANIIRNEWRGIGVSRRTSAEQLTIIVLDLDIERNAGARAVWSATCTIGMKDLQANGRVLRLISQA